MKLLLTFVALGLLAASAQAFDGCAICKTVVQTAAGLADEEESVIKGKLDAACKRIPVVGSYCQNIVDSYLHNIIQWLENGENEKQICEKIGLCSAEKVEEPKFDKCSICSTLVQIVDKLLGQDISVIEEKVNSLCEQLPGALGDECKTLVDKELENVINYLNQGDTAKEICAKIGLCTAVVKDINVDGCSICTEIVQTVFGMLDSSEPEIETEVDKLCDDLGFLATPCKMLVKEYLPKAIEYLESGKTVEEVCSEFGLCKRLTMPAMAKLRTPTQKMMPMVKLAAAKPAVKRSPMVKLAKAKAAPEPKAWECDLCKSGVAEVLKLLNDSEADIQKELDSLCMDLGPIASLCKSLVDEYLPEVINYLETGLTVDQVCQEIDLCSAARTHPMIAMAKLRKIQKKVAEPKFSKCSICKKIVDVVYGALDMGEEAIKKLVDKEVCKKLGPVSGVCDLVVNEFLDEIIKLLKEGVSPDDVCSKIDLCSTMQRKMHMRSMPAMAKVRSIQKPAEPKFSTCSICKKVVDVVYDALDMGEAEIKKLVDDEVCKKLGPLSSACDLVVNEFLDKIISMLEDGVTPDDVCGKIDLCSSMQRQMLKQPWRPSRLTPAARSGTCTVCELLLKVAGGLLNKEDDEIKTELDAVCTHLGPLANLCTTFVNKEIDTIIASLRNGETEEKICQKLRMCPATMQF